ncbi:hypothetical protein N3K66_008690 [Trichothecium roseum]|uniref:Uncharacterized protein n=1 Tax=Trichothecium roseum TaxID=47278 RepID=A0ACC0UQY1_9HYPO|nr:hypothetical protein N3K66_008690 [Trichothecium roseum]
MDVKSGSRFRDIDFYSLRVLIPRMRKINNLEKLNKYVSQARREEAASLITGDDEWKNYLDKLEYTTTTIRQEGLAGVGRFTDALILNIAINNDLRSIGPDRGQKRRPRSQSTEDAISDQTKVNPATDNNQDPTGTPSGPSRTNQPQAPTPRPIDEQAVHIACWSLLSNMSISDGTTRVYMTWAPTQVALRCPFAQGSQPTTSTSQGPVPSAAAQMTRPRGVYEARVDGAALCWDSGKCFAITEEAAEVAAWIAESPPSWGKDESDSKTRLLIAQDRDSLYVVFGVFNYEYVKWIQGASRGDEKEPSFLTMQSFGPYRTRAKGDMVLFQAVVQGHLGQYKEA